MPRVFFVAIPHCLSRHWAVPEARLFKLSGRNLGNLLFTDALWRQLRFDGAEVGYTFDPVDVSGRFDAIVIPAANWLSPTSDWAELAGLLEKTTIPITLVGVGSQAPSGCRECKLKPGTLRMLKIVSERSRSIGVRGQVAAEILAANGIGNVRVIGCPSLYWHCRPGIDTMPRKSEAEAESGRFGVLYSSTSFGAPGRLARMDGTTDIQKFIGERAYRDGSFMVIQSELPELSFALSDEPRTIPPELLTDLLARYGAENEEELTHYMNTRLVAFLDAGEWVGAMRRFDFVIGTRLHATIAALLAGVVAALITHDSRTQEIAELAALPTVTAEQFRSVSVKEIYSGIHLDQFVQRQDELYASYVEFLEENSLEHRMAVTPRERKG